MTLDRMATDAVALRHIVVAGEGDIPRAISAAFENDGVTAATGFNAVAVACEAAIHVVEATDRGLFAAVSANAIGAPLKTAFTFLRQATESLRRGPKGGSIVIVAPPSALQAAHDAVRQGLRLMVKAAALELGPEHIRVNIVLPGSADSPLGKPCAPIDIARAVAFLASDRALFITGADLVVDGGGMAR